jgi:predicted transglutaminase-like cysteine proteinase
MSLKILSTEESEELIKATCDAVHARAKRLFTWASDQVRFGELERWHSFITEFRADQPFEGDCDDFMCTCADALIDELIPEELISYATCLTESGELHAVLVVSGIWVLDNRQQKVRHITTLPYSWDRVMAFSEPGIWRAYG